MSDRPMMLTQFLGVTLHNGTTIRQVVPYELSGKQAVTRIFRLANGAKFDADGDDDGDTMLGNLRATFRVTGATHSAANALLLALEALLNRRGTLGGVEYLASTTLFRSCNARCLVARPIMRAGMPMAVGRIYQIDVEMSWEQFTNWN
mgnify:FL=1